MTKGSVLVKPHIQSLEPNQLSTQKVQS